MAGVPATDRAACRNRAREGPALVNAMRKALEDAPAAAECVVDAETKDQQNWERIGGLAKTLGGEPGRILGEACVKDEEDEHLHHARGWCTEEGASLTGRATPPGLYIGGRRW